LEGGQVRHHLNFVTPVMTWTRVLRLELAARRISPRGCLQTFGGARSIRCGRAGPRQRNEATGTLAMDTQEAMGPKRTRAWRPKVRWRVVSAMHQGFPVMLLSLGRRLSRVGADGDRLYGPTCSRVDRHPQTPEAPQRCALWGFWEVLRL
jgi:hypothetical protein